VQHLSEKDSGDCCGASINWKMKEKLKLSAGTMVLNS